MPFTVEVHIDRWYDGFESVETEESAEALASRLMRNKDVIDVRIVDEHKKPVRFLCRSCGTWQPEDTELVECNTCQMLT